MQQPVMHGACTPRLAGCAGRAVPGRATREFAHSRHPRDPARPHRICIGGGHDNSVARDALSPDSGGASTIMFQVAHQVSTLTRRRHSHLLPPSVRCDVPFLV